MSEPPLPELILRVNGRYGAWTGDFYADTSRDVALHQDPYRRANTSISLILRSGSEVLLHVIIDAGLGALNSLLDYQRQAGVNRVDALFLTHSHFDHIAGLDWLGAMIRRSDVPGQVKPLPLYCSDPSYEEAIGRRFVWLKDLYVHRSLQPGVPVSVTGQRGACLEFTPISVEHGPTAPGALIFRVDHAEANRRLVFAWDMLRLSPGAGEDLLRDADLLFVDSTSWHPQFAKGDPGAAKVHNTWHSSIEEWLDRLPAWRPKRTYLIHYSGFSDSNAHEGCPDPAWHLITGVQTQEQLRSHARRESERLGMDIRVAQHGMLIPFDEPWP